LGLGVPPSNHRYLRERLPKSKLELIDAGGLPNPSNELERSGYEVYLGREADDRRSLATMVIPPNRLPGPEFIQSDAALTTLTEIALADALFAPLGRNLRDVDGMLAKNLAEEVGLHLLTVLV
jgi:hypothetical protein